MVVAEEEPVALEEAQAIAAVLAEAEDLMMTIRPGARVTAPGEAQAWEAVALEEEGEWEWVGWVWVTWVTWEGWEWVEEEGGQAPGAVEQEVQ